MKVLSKALAVALCLLSSHAIAAEVGSGSLTISEKSLSFSNSLVVGVNVSNQLPDGETCLDPVFSCDTYALTTALPEDLSTVFPTALFRIILTPMDSLTGADDFDLSLVDAEGNILASSGNLPGETEAVAAQALDGSNTYTVRVVNWAVVGGGYEVKIDLSLGAPSEEMSDEEVAAWLAENGGGSSSRALLASCSEPGVEILSDASGDAPLPLPGQDLLALNVFQTVEEDGSSLIGFQLKVDDLSQLIPQTTYFISFEAYGDVRGVRMLVDQEGVASYETYVVSEDSDGEREGHFADVSKPADSRSNHSSDGLITIYAQPSDVLLFEAGDTLEGFNSGIMTLLGHEAVGHLSLNGDTMPEELAREGSFEFRATEDCSDDTATATGRSVASNVKGGATGSIVLLFLSVLGYRRRKV